MNEPSGGIMCGYARVFCAVRSLSDRGGPGKAGRFLRGRRAE